MRSRLPVRGKRAGFDLVARMMLNFVGDGKKVKVRNYQLVTGLHGDVSRCSTNEDA